MQDFLVRNWIRARVDEVRRDWVFPVDFLPPGFDIEPVLKYISDRVPVPEVSYCVDALAWYVYGTKGSEHHPALPDHNPDRNRFYSPFGGGGDILWLSDLSVEGPIGRKATWKVVYSRYPYRFWHILDRFGLERGRAHAILYAIARTPDDKIRRYPTQEAAKRAVEKALLKIGLVGPIVEPEDMHTVTGWDS
jgi:hypothetical protein